MSINHTVSNSDCFCSHNLYIMSENCFSFWGTPTPLGDLCPQTPVHFSPQMKIPGSATLISRTGVDITAEANWRFVKVFFICSEVSIGAALLLKSYFRLGRGMYYVPQNENCWERLRQITTVSQQCCGNWPNAEVKTASNGDKSALYRATVELR